MKGHFLARGKSACLALAAGACLAACSATPPLGAQRSVSDTRYAGGERATAPQALLYLSNIKSNDVDVYSYPQRTFISKITNLGNPRSECADAAGNVWIAVPETFEILEYAHGGSSPLVALSTPGIPRGCSVNPVNGDVAVSGGGNGIVLSVYHHSGHSRWRDPRYYTDASMHAGYFCGYDAQGNLFLDGTGGGKQVAFRLAELAHGKSALADISLSQSIAAPGQVQWDGTYLAIGDTGVAPSVVYRFSVTGSSANEVGVTTLAGTKSVRQFWIDGDRVIGPDFGSDVGIWKYPAGGKAIGSIALPGYGAAVSAGQ